jgi:hypothetical protein
MVYYVVTKFIPYNIVGEDLRSRWSYQNNFGLGRDMILAFEGLMLGFTLVYEGINGTKENYCI